MKIGVVCEGVTDFHAINHYVGAALKKEGVNSEFVALQPLPDNTSCGGWSQVLTWLENNPPESRIQLFERGLFANSKKFSGIDSIIIHLDTDILPEASFVNFLKIRNFELKQTNSLNRKSNEIIRLIGHFAQLSSCTDEYAKKHISAPIAESSEAWCVAADPNFQGSAELLSGQELINAFGISFANYNKKTPKKHYASINKKSKSRENYCRDTAENSERLKTCVLFAALLKALT